MRRQRGFTLIELIVVISLLGVISLVSVGFITSTVQGYADLTRRDQLSSAVRVAVDRMSRELRNALPNSIRVSADGSCLEFIPSLAASVYVSVPLSASAASTSFSSVPYAVEPSSGRIAVYPIDSNGSDEPARPASNNPIYDLDSHSIISPLMQVGNVLQASAGEVSVLLSASHYFPADSPAKRYFIVDEPVSFCVEGTDLYRYQGESGSSYSYAETQASQALLSGLSEPYRQLLASDVLSNPSGSQPFAFSDATLQRNGLVLFDLYVEDQDITAADRTQESVRVQFEVHIKNVP